MNIIAFKPFNFHTFLYLFIYVLSCIALALFLNKNKQYPTQADEHLFNNTKSPTNKYCDEIGFNINMYEFDTHWSIGIIKSTTCLTTKNIGDNTIYILVGYGVLFPIPELQQSLNKIPSFRSCLLPVSFHPQSLVYFLFRIVQHDEGENNVINTIVPGDQYLRGEHDSKIMALYLTFDFNRKFLLRYIYINI